VLETLAPTRQALLTAMKRAGEARADDLASELGITVSAVRQHLAGLAADGLVDHRDVRRGPGRPHHLYRLSDKGDGLFPRRYGVFAAELLDELEAESPELIGKLFEGRRRRRVERARVRLEGKPFEARVRELTSILDEDGYLAEVVPMDGGRFRIVEHNCAILAVATRYGAACGTELEFLREVLPDATVERVAHLLAGGHVCAYEVTPLTSSTRTPRKPSPTS
jgi:DeoR family suf operon transcriptional repressor